jgi:hypothetical protein
VKVSFWGSPWASMTGGRPAASIISRHLRSTTDGHEYHLQVTASAGGSSDANLFTAVPDLDLLNALRANQDPGWIAITLRATGQMIGHPVLNPVTASRAGSISPGKTTLGPERRARGSISIPRTPI